MLVSAVLAPTTPPKVVTPVVLTDRVCAPFTVPPKVMAPEPLLASVVSAPKVTASLYVCAPLVFTAPPLSATVPGASVVMLVSAALAPTTPLKVVAPAVLTARAFAPFTVLPKEMAPEAELASMVSAPRLTASLKVCAPVVRNRPPLMVVLPPASVVTLVNAVLAPTALPKVVVPAVLTVKLCAPFTVPTKVMAPEPVLASVVSAPKVTASL